MAPALTPSKRHTSPGHVRSAAGSLPSSSLFDLADGGPTLDELLAGVWEGLTADSVVDCPVCGSELEPEYGARLLPVGGRCRGCDSVLA